VLVYVLLASFALYSGLYTWRDVVRGRTVHVGHLADLTAGGAGMALERWGRGLAQAGAAVRAGAGAVAAFRATHPEWVALAVRGAGGRWRRVFGPQPPRAVLAAHCVVGAGCVAALERTRRAVHGVGKGRLWLMRAVGRGTLYGAQSLAALAPLWSRFPARAADRLYLRGPQGSVVRVWPPAGGPAPADGPAAMRVLAWRAVPGTAVAFGAGATGASVRAQWWGIVWPEALFLVSTALVAEGVMRGFERRAAHAAVAVAAEQARVRRVRDLYAALSDTNQLIVRHPQPEELFATTCRLLVERAGACAARIGWVEGGVGDPVVRWVTRAGSVETEAATDPGAIARKAVITGRTQRAAARTYSAGYRRGGGVAQLALPIRRGADIAAVLWLYAGRVGLEDRAERALLEEMVLDLGFSLEDTAQRRRLEYAAEHDALTGLVNRRCLVRALQEAQRGDAAGVLAVFYLEGLREVNATLGHSAGDEILSVAATRLQAVAAARAGILAARGDGDRFFLMLPGVGSEEAARRVNEVQEVLAAPLRLSGGEDLRVESAAGWARWPEHWNGSAALMGRAELALEAAHARGPGECAGFEPELEERAHAARRVRREFEPALERGELTLYYQPVLDLATGAVQGMEALVRWIMPDGGVRLPGAFLPQVEQDPRLLRELGRFVLGEALSRIAAWSRAGLAVDVAVNIGASHLTDPAFLEDLDGALAGYGAQIGRRLLIEITESAYLGERGAAAVALEAARARGVRTVLDDFGTAYASLSYLQDLPVDRIKIDGSFTSRLLQGRREEAIVGGVVMTARLLGLDLVAEGVESDAQAELLRHLGCPKLQGYRIARPMPAEQAEAWLRDWDPTPWAHAEEGVLTPLFDRAEVLALALQDWGGVRALARAAGGEPADPPGCCPWLRAADGRSPFGRWLAGSGRDRYGRDPAFQALAAEQESLARAARRLTAPLDGGERAQREEAARSLVGRYDVLLRRLGALPLTPGGAV
jgi:diguanylate cyclase (GGDEF)-like protein